MKVKFPSLVFSIVFLLAIILGFIGNGTIIISANSGETITAKLSPFDSMNKTEIEKAFDKYLEDKKDNSDRWITFMSILSTVFAIFFVYSGFKLDGTVDKVEDAEKKMSEAYEYFMQLEYGMSFLMQRQYDKAIDVIEVLKKEPFVWKDQKRQSTCNFFLANFYYERGSQKNCYDDLVIAVQYIDDAITNDGNPFKLEIINKFNELDSIKNNLTS